MKASSNTKERILDLAAHLIQSRGFNAFSYQQISKELGFKNAAIHYHYPTKELLAQDVLTRFLDWFNDCTSSAAHAALDPWQKLDWLIDIYRSNLTQGGRMCLIGAMGSDYLMVPTPLKTILNDAAITIWKWLSKVLQQGLDEDLFSFNGDAENKASLILTSLIGILQVSRLTGDHVFELTIDQIKLDLKK